MAKKNTTTKPAVPAKSSALPTIKMKPPTKVEKAAKVPPTAAPGAKPKAKAKAPASKVAPRSAAAGFTLEDVSLRAYFLSEKRRATGLPGDEHQDWVEAERQLRAENKAGRKTKKS